MPKRDLSPDAKASTPKKTKIYKTNYNSNWAKTYTWVSKSAKDCHHAYCSACKIDFSISHSGEFDVKQHAKGSKHQAAMDSTQSTKKMNDLLFLVDYGCFGIKLWCCGGKTESVHK